jgi:hypothetical protein
VAAEVERQLQTLSTVEIAGPAWHNYGSVTVAKDRETAVILMDDLLPNTPRSRPLMTPGVTITSRTTGRFFWASGARWPTPTRAWPRTATPRVDRFNA